MQQYEQDKQSACAIGGFIGAIIFGILSSLTLFRLLDVSFLLCLPIPAICILFIFLIVPEKRASRLFEWGTAIFLCYVFSFGLILLDTLYFQMGIFLTSLAIYHCAEYLFVCSFHYPSLSFDSFLLNQSLHYGIAMIVGFVEYGIEVWLFGEYKIVYAIIYLGGIGAIAGHIFRIGSLFMAGKSFHHQIQEKSDPSHILITTGLYSICRHPSYLGWYLWSVCTQMILVNPISFFLYLYACHIFFSIRVNYEEETLINMFGQSYLDYMQKVPTRIPFVPGLDPLMFLPGRFHKNDLSFNGLHRRY